MNYSNLELKNQICHRLYIATNGITRLYRPLLESLDLTYPQYILMMALWELEKSAILEIQKVTNIDSGSLTQILSKVRDKGYIKISPSEEDKRKKIVSLTEKGLKLKDKAVEIPKEITCQVSNLDMEDYKTLIKLLDKLNKNFN